MESLSDLCTLPTSTGSWRGTNYNYTTSNWAIAPDEWHKQQYWKMVYEHAYDNILRIRHEIADYDKRIAQLSKGAFPGIRIARVEAERRPLVKRLEKLEKGWAKIARSMTEDSRKLFALPREIREKIYAYLYIEKFTIDFDLPDIDVRYSLLPPDHIYYLNASIVDPVIAAEAAQVFYDMNIFNIHASYAFQSTSYGDILSHFLNTDHYGSGVVPRDVIRRLRVTVETTSVSRHDHVSYERHRPDSTDNPSSRKRLAPVLEMKSLRILTIEMKWGKYQNLHEFREFSPVVKMLMEKGVPVKVVKAQGAKAKKSGKVKDFSKYFDKPTAREWEAVNEKGGLARWKPGRDGKKWGLGEHVMWRCFLDEHYQVFQEREARKKEEGYVEDCLSDSEDAEDTASLEGGF